MSDDLYKLSREGLSPDSYPIGEFDTVPLSDFNEHRTKAHFDSMGFGGRPKEDWKHFPDGEFDASPSGGYFTAPVKHPINPSLRFDCIKIAAGLPDAYSTADVIRNGNTIYEAVTK